MSRLLLRRLDRLRACTRMGFAHMLVYRKAVVIQAAATILQIFLLTRIWRAVSVTQQGHSGLALHQLTVYLTLASMQTWATTVTVSRYVKWRVILGTIFFDLGRPASFVGQVVFLQLGETAALSLFVVVALPVAFAVGGLSTPVSVTAGLCYVIALVTGYFITLLIALLIGLISFWTLEVGGLEMLVRLIAQFFSGAMIPLVFFPRYLRMIADLLPFKYVAYVPASIYVGGTRGEDRDESIVVGVVWVALLALATRLAWRSAHRKVVIQGG